VVPVQGAAVPAVVPELVLALPDPLLGSLPDRLHDVGVPLAQLPLLVHQPGDVIADHPRAQRPDVPAREKGDALPRCPQRGKVQGSGSPGPRPAQGACTKAHLSSSLSRCVTAALGSAEGIPLSGVQTGRTQGPGTAEPSQPLRWGLCVSTALLCARVAAAGSRGPAEPPCPGGQQLWVLQAGGPGHPVSGWGSGEEPADVQNLPPTLCHTPQPRAAARPC